MQIDNPWIKLTVLAFCMFIPQAMLSSAGTPDEMIAQGRQFIQEGKYSEAETLLKEALKIQRDTHCRVRDQGNTVSWLISALEKQGKQEEADKWNDWAAKLWSGQESEPPPQSAPIVVSGPTSSDSDNDALKGVMVKVLKTERFTSIDNQYEKLGKGRIFLALLLTITNNSDNIIDGGGSDYHSTFNLKTTEGYTIEAENTSSDAWRKDRMVWNADLLSPGETGKGWVVFSVPESATIEYLIFKVDRYNGPHSFTEIGMLKIPL